MTLAIAGQRPARPHYSDGLAMSCPSLPDAVPVGPCPRHGRVTVTLVTRLDALPGTVVSRSCVRCGRRGAYGGPVCRGCLAASDEMFAAALAQPMLWPAEDGAA